MGLVKIKVIDPGLGTGLLEFYGGGHSETLPPNKMCQLCTFSRMKIINCNEHLMVAVDHTEELDEIAKSPDLTAEVLATLDERKEAGDEIKICSICPSLAMYECACIGEFDAEGNPAGELNENREMIEGVIGCGLNVCEICAVTLANKAGNLAQAIKRAKLTTSLTGDYPDGVRADVEFLTEDGLLWTSLQQQNEVEERRVAKEAAGERERVRIGGMWI